MKCLVFTSEIAESYISEYIELEAPSETKVGGEYEKVWTDCETHQKKIVQVVEDDEVFEVHNGLIWVNAPEGMTNSVCVEDKWYYDENDSTIKAKPIAPLPAEWTPA